MGIGYEDEVGLQRRVSAQARHRAGQKGSPRRGSSTSISPGSKRVCARRLDVSSLVTESNAPRPHELVPLAIVGELAELFEGKLGYDFNSHARITTRFSAACSNVPEGLVARRSLSGKPGEPPFSGRLGPRANDHDFCRLDQRCSAWPLFKPRSRHASAVMIEVMLWPPISSTTFASKPTISTLVTRPMSWFRPLMKCSNPFGNFNSGSCPFFLRLCLPLRRRRGDRFPCEESDGVRPPCARILSCRGKSTA